MGDLSDEDVMTAYLLRTVDAETRERIDDRLAADETYCEEMAALDDDLILRWHRQTLSPSQRDQFARAYAEPARAARVEDARILLLATRTARAEPASVPAAATRPGPAYEFTARWLALAASVILLAGVSLVYLSRVTPAGTLDVPLTAVGEKGTAGAGFDRVVVRSSIRTIRLSVTVVNPPAAPWIAELATPDGSSPARVLGAPGIESSGGGTTASVTLPADQLPNGDYVLRVRTAATGEPIATQAFRVTRK